MIKYNYNKKLLFIIIIYYNKCLNCNIYNNNYLYFNIYYNKDSYYNIY